jgi:integrase
MATVNFYPRTKKGSSKIQARISIGRHKNFLISTRISVSDVENDWDFKKKTPRDSKRAKFLSVLETKFLNHITDMEIDLSKSISDIKSDDFRQIVYDIHRIPEKERTFTKDDSKSISSYIDKYVTKRITKGYRTKGNQLKQYAKGTLRKYEQLKATIELFEKEEGIKANLNSFDSKLIDSFESFLTDQYAISTAGRKLKSLKTILTNAYNEGEEVDPYFRNIKGYSYETTVVPLSEMEQELIFSTPMPNDVMEYAKDWLLMLCGTGQRFVDCNALTKDNIKNDAIVLTQRKTGATVEIPIFDRVQRIIDKYDGFPPKFSDNEGSQNAHLNKMVKDVCEECEINEVLKESKNGKIGEYPKHELITTKTGRKSLATYLYKESRWDAQSCMAITGHKQLENFFIYVGGKNSAITEANKLRVSEINKIIIENRSKSLKASS